MQASQTSSARSNTYSGYKPSLKPLRSPVKFGNEGFVQFIGEIEPNSLVISGAIGSGVFSLTGKLVKTVYRAIFKKSSTDTRIKSIEGKLDQLLKNLPKTTATDTALGKEEKTGWLSQIKSWFPSKQENTSPSAPNDPSKK